MRLLYSKPRYLDSIFANDNPFKIAIDLTQHCSDKMKLGQALTEAERTYDLLREFGRKIANDGFVSVFHESLTEETFAVICDALAEVGAEILRGLLLEAWSLYTNDRKGLTPAELRAIPWRRFNTPEKVARFEQIRVEVEAELETGKFWPVEYAKAHRDGFTPIAPGKG